MCYMQIGGDRKTMKKGTDKGTGKETRQEQARTRERVYSFIVDFMTENLYAPTIGEICAGIHSGSVSSVYGHLLKLEGEGKTKMKSNSTRAITLAGYKLIKAEGQE